jgi:hypothetical protein
MSSTNFFTYRVSGTGSMEFLSILGNQYKELTTEIIPIISHPNSSFSGTMRVLSGSIEL